MPKRGQARAARLKRLGGKRSQYSQGALSGPSNENHRRWRHRAQTGMK
jgi:hypothetical protein